MPKMDEIGPLLFKPAGTDYEDNSAYDWLYIGKFAVNLKKIK